MKAKFINENIKGVFPLPYKIKLKEREDNFSGSVFFYTEDADMYYGDWIYAWMMDYDKKGRVIYYGNPHEPLANNVGLKKAKEIIHNHWLTIRDNFKQKTNEAIKGVFPLKYIPFYIVGINPNYPKNDGNMAYKFIDKEKGLCLYIY